MGRRGFTAMGAMLICLVLLGCAPLMESKGSGRVHPAAQEEKAGLPDEELQRPPVPERITDHGWTRRVFKEEEFLRWEKLDPTLDRSQCVKILARLNTKADFSITGDIRDGRPLQVPNDFRAFRDWNPLPDVLPNLSHLPRSIVVVKDIPFLGWYARGKRVGGSHVGLGKPGEATEAGVFRVLEKEADKYSRSYRNDFGEPAWMPWALRVYDAVWIHAGYLTGPYCSHGCLILPVEAAEELFHWSDTQTVVVITESLEDLRRLLSKPLRAASP
ncbi:MAG: L,D-transpeptidase [Deltaproteobacteria bacterium]|nr:L,D-transpeptidase [Deltaproteobacteria bacterium]